MATPRPRRPPKSKELLLYCGSAFFGSAFPLASVGGNFRQSNSTRTKKRGWSQEDLAYRANIDRSYGRCWRAERNLLFQNYARLHERSAAMSPVSRVNPTEPERAIPLVHETNMLKMLA